MRRTNLLRTLATTFLSVGFAVAAASSCSLITSSDIAPGGIGQPCKDDSDCQGASCDNGLCTAACSTTAQCPEPSQCLNNTCQLPLRVAGIWIGLATAAEGWTLTHQEGIEFAKEKLGYIDYVYEEGVLGEPAEKAIDKYVADGYQVIIANSWDHLATVRKKAAQYPNTTFLHCSGIPVEPNVSSFFAHMEHAWYVAGRIAARKSKTGHLGFIGSFVTAEVVRHLNAFALGAKKENPNAKVEVRWLGFWYDVDFDKALWEYTPKHMGDKAVKKNMTGEEYLTAKLIDSGADVITHNLDNQLPSRYVGIHTTAKTMKNPKNPDQDWVVWTIANDNIHGWRDQSGQPFANAIGATCWNWGYPYIEIFEDIHRGRLTSKAYMYPLTTDTETSVVGFNLSSAETDVTTLSLKVLLDEASKMRDVYEGPVKQTGQRPGGDIPPGTVIDENEWRNMCWFVDNVVERANPNDFDSELVSAKVPTATVKGNLGSQKEPTDGSPREPTTAPEILLDLGSNGAIWDCVTNSAPGG